MRLYLIKILPNLIKIFPYANIKEKILNNLKYLKECTLFNNLKMKKNILDISSHQLIPEILHHSS